MDVFSILVGVVCGACVAAVIAMLLVVAPAKTQSRAELKAQRGQFDERLQEKQAPIDVCLRSSKSLWRRSRNSFRATRMTELHHWRLSISIFRRSG